MEFSALVSIFELSGWQALGKIPSPLTGKAEVNLEAARNTVEILVLLREKTRGNLEAGEERHLSTVIADLQLNYASVREQEKSGPESAGEKGKGESAPEEEAKAEPGGAPGKEAGAEAGPGGESGPGGG